MVIEADSMRGAFGENKPSRVARDKETFVRLLQKKAMAKKEFMDAIKAREFHPAAYIKDGIITVSNDRGGRNHSDAELKRLSKKRVDTSIAVREFQKEYEKKYKKS